MADAGPPAASKAPAAAYVPPHRRGNGSEQRRPPGSGGGQRPAAPGSGASRRSRCGPFGGCQCGAASLDQMLALDKGRDCSPITVSRAQLSIYADRHAVACGECEPSLLGSAHQFCASFFHIEPTPEGGIGEVCLCAAAGGAPCPRKTVVGVGRLRAHAARAATCDGNGGSGDGPFEPSDAYVGRYSNCFTSHTPTPHLLMVDTTLTYWLTPQVRRPLLQLLPRLLRGEHARGALPVGRPRAARRPAGAAA